MTDAPVLEIIAAEAPGLTPAALPFLRELGDLKRVRSAAAPGSMAERLFVAGWAALVRGDDPAEVTMRVTAAALVSARLGDLDLAHQRGEGGVQEQMGLFFKLPQTRGDYDPVHGVPEQQLILDNWLDGRGA